MSDGDLFFTERNGEVWACWSSGRPPIKLGTEADVRAAMAQFSILAGEAVEGTDASRRREEPPEPEPPRPRTVSERVEPRHGLTLKGRVYAQGGSRDVTILDLSEHGCRFREASGLLREGSRLTIKLGEVGPIDSVVMWSDGSYVGLRFANALYPSVMDHIRASVAGRR